MWLLDMQYYISAENAVIFLTEISSRIIKFYLFPSLISCGTDSTPHIKLMITVNCQYIIWKPSSSSSSLSLWSLSFLKFSYFLVCSFELYLSVHPAFQNFFLLPWYFNCLLLKCSCSCLALLAFGLPPSFTLLFFSLTEVLLSVWGTRKYKILLVAHSSGDILLLEQKQGRKACRDSMVPFKCDHLQSLARKTAKEYCAEIEFQ